MSFTLQVFFSNFLPDDDSVHDPKLVAQQCQYMTTVMIDSCFSYSYVSFLLKNKHIMLLISLCTCPIMGLHAQLSLKLSSLFKLFRYGHVLCCFLNKSLNITRCSG